MKTTTLIARDKGDRRVGIEPIKIEVSIDAELDLDDRQAVFGLLARPLGRAFHALGSIGTVELRWADQCEICKECGGHHPRCPEMAP